jgi:hypothetical protein
VNLENPGRRNELESKTEMFVEEECRSDLDCVWWVIIVHRY